MRLIDADELDNVVTELNTKRGYGITRNEYKLISNVLFEFPKDDVLDKIIDDIQTLRGCSCYNSDGIIDDVEDIIDKYRQGAEE